MSNNSLTRTAIEALKSLVSTTGVLTNKTDGEAVASVLETVLTPIATEMGNDELPGMVMRIVKTNASAFVLQKADSKSDLTITVFTLRTLVDILKCDGTIAPEAILKIEGVLSALTK